MYSFMRGAGALHVPPKRRSLHRAARKRDRHAGQQFDPLRRLCGDRHGQHRVVRELAACQEVIALFFGLACAVTNARQPSAHPGADLHLRSPRLPIRRDSRESLRKSRATSSPRGHRRKPGRTAADRLALAIAPP
jgi:hypothetical protein